MLKEFLVEIRVKDWVKLPEGVSRTIAYEEVLAPDEYCARHAGYDQFMAKCNVLKLQSKDICAPDAVEINN